MNRRGISQRKDSRLGLMLWSSCTIPSENGHGNAPFFNIALQSVRTDGTRSGYTLLDSVMGK